MDDNNNKPRKETIKEKFARIKKSVFLESGEKNAKEKLYDKIPLTVKQLDIILVICAIAFFVAIILGVLNGRGII